jgi:hypothetical protein
MTLADLGVPLTVDEIEAFWMIVFILALAGAGRGRGRR